MHKVNIDSPCLSSDNESEQSFNLDDVACIDDDDDKERLATEGEAARCNADIITQGCEILHMAQEVTRICIENEISLAV